MKNKIYNIIITILIALTAGSVFAACGVTGGEKKYDHLVTFDYNVEILENQYLGVMDGSLVALYPGKDANSSHFPVAVLDGYYVEGWYLGKTDGEGNPVVDADGKVELSKEWDFTTDRVTSDITLYANFVPRATLVITGGDEDKVYQEVPGTVKEEPSKVLEPKKKGWTFLGYYADEGYTTEFSWPYTFEAGVTTTVYAKFMEGTWSLVSTAEQFISAYSTGKNIYLTGDLDFTGKKFPATSYNGEINGNGYKLSNISASFETKKNTQENFAIFGSLGAKAYLHDFIVENAAISFKYDGTWPAVDCRAALLVWKAAAGARLTNLTVSGTLTEAAGSQGTVEYHKLIAHDEGAIVTNCSDENIVVPTNE